MLMLQLLKVDFILITLYTAGEFVNSGQSKIISSLPTILRHHVFVDYVLYHKWRKSIKSRSTSTLYVSKAPE